MTEPITASSRTDSTKSSTNDTAKGLAQLHSTPYTSPYLTPYTSPPKSPKTQHQSKARPASPIPKRLCSALETPKRRSPHKLGAEAYEYHRRTRQSPVRRVRVFPPDGISQRFCPIAHLHPLLNMCSIDGYRTNRGVRYHLLSYHAPVEMDKSDKNKEVRERMTKEQWWRVKKMAGLDNVNKGARGYWKLVEFAMGLEPGLGEAEFKKFEDREEERQRQHPPTASDRPPHFRHRAFKSEETSGDGLESEDGPEDEDVTAWALEQCETRGRPVTRSRSRSAPAQMTPPPRSSRSGPMAPLRTAGKRTAKEGSFAEPQAQGPQEPQESLDPSEREARGQVPLANGTLKLGSVTFEDLIISEVGRLCTADLEASFVELQRTESIRELKALTQFLEHQKGSKSTENLPDVVVRPKWLFRDALYELHLIALDVLGMDLDNVTKESLGDIAQRIRTVHGRLWTGENSENFDTELDSKTEAEVEKEDGHDRTEEEEENEETTTERRADGETGAHGEE